MHIPKVDLPEGSKGPWKVKRFTIEEDNLQTLRLAMQGRYCPPGTYTALRHEERGVVMSDTPAEMRDHAEFIAAAQGHCLIMGLGLGMCLQAVMLKPQVTHCTVVELDQDVIDLVWPTYQERYGARINLIRADALEWRPPTGVRYGAVWFDIWDSICEDNRGDMKLLTRRFGRKADWKGSWGRDTLDAERRRNRNNPWAW